MQKYVTSSKLTELIERHSAGFPTLGKTSKAEDENRSALLMSTAWKDFINLAYQAYLDGKDGKDSQLVLAALDDEVSDKVQSGMLEIAAARYLVRLYDVKQNDLDMREQALKFTQRLMTDAHGKMVKGMQDPLEAAKDALFLVLKKRKKQTEIQMGKREWDESDSEAEGDPELDEEDPDKKETKKRYAEAAVNVWAIPKLLIVEYRLINGDVFEVGIIPKDKYFIIVIDPFWGFGMHKGDAHAMPIDKVCVCCNCTAMCIYFNMVDPVSTTECSV